MSNSRRARRGVRRAQVGWLSDVVRGSLDDLGTLAADPAPEGDGEPRKGQDEPERVMDAERLRGTDQQSPRVAYRRLRRMGLSRVAARQAVLSTYHMQRIAEGGYDDQVRRRFNHESVEGWVPQWEWFRWGDRRDT